MERYLLQHAKLITLHPPSMESADIRITGGTIVEKSAELTPEPGDTVIDLSEKIVMPGIVCAHTHLYSALARGMPGPMEAPRNFPEILEKIWWRLDKALDEESLYYSTVIGVLEALMAGTTTIIDHNASPGFLRGSLKLMKEIFEEYGVRGVLCYETTDRGGTQERDWGIEENRWLLEHQSALVKGLVGAHAAFTLCDDSLHLCADLMRRYKSGIHIHLAEDTCDITDAYAQYEKGLVERLDDSGVLDSKSILAHGVHLSANDLQKIEELGCWLVHNPRSNMNNSVGYFRQAATRPANTALGTDGIGSNMFEEVKFAYFKAQDAGNPLGADDCMRFLQGGQQIASEMFDLPFGTFESGAAADLIVLDYPAPTPVHAGNLAWQMIFGMSHAHVESVMVNGRWRIRDHQFVGRDIASLYRKAREAAQKLWRRMEML